MRSPIIPLLLGFTFIAGAIAIDVRLRSIQRADVRDVAGLVAELDSVRAALHRSNTRADSISLAESIERRTYMLGRREFHIPSRQATIDGWWTIAGAGIALTAIGSLLLVLAALTWRRGRAP